MRKHVGFTLVELMIAVAIVAILAGIAYPQYSDYVVRTRLADAQSSLASVRVRMEQWFQDNRDYSTAPVCVTPPTPKEFTITCGNLTATTYEVRATGSGTAAGFVLTVDQAGLRATPNVKTGWGTAQANCWVIRKAGCS